MVNEPLIHLSDYFRTISCLNFLLEIDNAPSAHKLDLSLSGDKENPTGLPNKWLKGTTMRFETLEKCAAKLKSIHKGDPSKIFKLEQVLELYKLPIFELIDDQPISYKRICSLLADWYVGDLRGFYIWKFPDSQLLNDYPYKKHKMDSVYGGNSIDGLYERGDIYALTALIALLKLNESKTSIPELYRMYLMMAYRMIPSVAQNPIFRKNINLLIDCLDCLYRTNAENFLIFFVDKEILNQQINDPEFETMRAHWKKDPLSHRFMAPADPIVLYANNPQKPK